MGYTSNYISSCKLMVRIIITNESSFLPIANTEKKRKKDVPTSEKNEKAPLMQDHLKPPGLVPESQKNEKAPLTQDHLKSPPVLVPESQKNEKAPLTQDQKNIPPPVASDPQTTPITNPQSDDIEQTEMKEDTDETGESDVSEGRELISDPLLRSNLESLVSPSSSETLDPSEFIRVHQVRDTLDNIVSTSDLFHFPEGPKKYRVVVLPKGKALHFVYKVIVFPKSKYAHPKVFKLVIIPGKITRLGRKVTFIVIPKDAPGSWKQYIKMMGEEGYGYANKVYNYGQSEGKNKNHGEEYDDDCKDCKGGMNKKGEGEDCEDYKVVRIKCLI
ncbi:9616_t:CDS:2 [Cetraspora pellucida]|uniref:9616_t:CDS:1 n=1 Tax=Cetraspora pellucida TaxID=1433469 RepID=A0A9N9HWK6_9GLOM|nr:9616_t:CDS:2 [Cetraspora pellucida]